MEDETTEFEIPVAVESCASTLILTEVGLPFVPKRQVNEQLVMSTVSLVIFCGVADPEAI